jgi:hypothetical protein
VSITLLPNLVSGVTMKNARQNLDNGCSARKQTAAAAADAEDEAKSRCAGVKN